MGFNAVNEAKSEIKEIIMNAMGVLVSKGALPAAIFRRMPRSCAQSRLKPTRARWLSR